MPARKNKTSTSADLSEAGLVGHSQYTDTAELLSATAGLDMLQSCLTAMFEMIDTKKDKSPGQSPTFGSWAMIWKGETAYTTVTGRVPFQ
jgi:hypothetical protein